MTPELYHILLKNVILFSRPFLAPPCNKRLPLKTPNLISARALIRGFTVIDKASFKMEYGVRLIAT